MKVLRAAKIPTKSKKLQLTPKEIKKPLQNVPASSKSDLPKKSTPCWKALGHKIKIGSVWFHFQSELGRKTASENWAKIQYLASDRPHAVVSDNGWCAIPES
jgi:hypothetical protein